ncbi:hypothetical protein LEMLEM_LOCUS9904 [Lemmus lemmus]
MILAVLRIRNTWNDNNQNIGVLCLFESSFLISPQVEKETSPKEPAPIVLKKTDPEERKEFVPNDLEESGPKDANECGPKEPGVFAPKEPKEFCVNTLDVLVDNMLTAVQDGDCNSLIAFLCIYLMCATIQQVLDVLYRWRESRMLSCCFGVHGGSYLKNKKSRGHSGGHGGAWRIRVPSWIQCLWPFGQKETTLNEGSQAQDHKDQVEKESAPKVPKEAAPEDMKEFIPNDPKVSGPNDPKVSGPNDPKESASKDTQMAQRDPMKSPFKSLDLLLDDMLTSMQEEDRHALIAFMCTSSMNSTIPQVLDLLFRGYDCEGDEEVKK